MFNGWALLNIYHPLEQIEQQMWLIVYFHGFVQYLKMLHETGSCNSFVRFNLFYTIPPRSQVRIHFQILTLVIVFKIARRSSGGGNPT